MDISVERERERQQQQQQRLRELAMKNRGVREEVERKRAVDPRERSAERGPIPERGMLERERLPERPVMLERPLLVDMEPKAVVPLGRMLEREGRVAGDLPHVLGRGGPLERLRGLGSREREDDRTPERTREPDRDVVGNDRDAEREESMRELVSSYKSALAELTFNSKPIITNLTIIAGENTHAAKGISSTVFNHIMEVPKEQKLPSLYLLDSIVKNIGGDYIKYFAARLPLVFCTAYKQVDPTTNPAMQHLFRTWRGVFPPGPLRLIESELQISSSAPNGPSGGTPPARPIENPISRAGHESPIPRTGHGIHVNPKYLEAQRQRLQQSGQAESVGPESNGTTATRGAEGPNLRENSKGWADPQLRRPSVPSRGQRDEYTDPGFGREASFEFEYNDYGPDSGPNNGRKSGPSRMRERDDGWDPGYLQDIDGEGFGHEEGRNPRSRYGPRNGYDWRQPPSRSTDIDGYGYNRGPGPGRGGPFRPVQAPVDGSGVRGRGAPDNWLKTEEEEYVWEDMSPRLRPPQVREEQRTGDRLSKDDWYPSESGRGIPVGETGRLKRTSQDAGFGDNSSWRRNGPGVPMQQSHPAGDRQPIKEYEERRSMQSGIGREPGVALMDQSTGLSRGSMSGLRPNAGWPSQGNSVRNLSPPARTRPGPLQLSVPTTSISPTARSTPNLLPRAGTPPTPSNGVGHPLSSGHFESRQMSRTNVGNFGGGLPSYTSLSPVTPAPGSSFQQLQLSHRLPPSPTRPSHQSHLHQIPPIPSSQPQNAQTHLQLQHEQSNHLLGRHRMHISGQLQSSQALLLAPQSQGLQEVPPSQVVPPLLQSGQQSLHQSLQHLSPQQGQNHQPNSQIPALQQSQQLPGHHQAQVPVQQPPPQMNQLQTHPQLQQHVHQLSQPLLPLISSQLAQSLQQLAQQQAQQSQQSQSLAPQPQPQTSQSLNLLTQILAPVANGPSDGLVQSSENQSSNSNLLAAFLQSGLIPPSQNTQSLPVLSRVSTTSLHPSPPQSSFQGQPPLPSGPPPAQFTNSVGTASAVQVGVPGQMSSIVATTINQMTTFGGQPNRYSQPPLPPGPPPASSIVGSASTTSSAPSGGVISSSISSLLSSLVAHGVIAAPGQNNAVPPVPNSSISIVAAQHNGNASFGLVGVLPSASVSPPSTTIPPVPSTVHARHKSPPRATAQDAPPSPGKPKKEAMNVHFRQELLRERHESVLEALYSDFPRQCTTCGLRFKAQDEHSKHMDWHVSRNRRQKSQKKVSRKWFVSAKQWLSGTSAAASEFAPSFFAEEPGVEEENSELVAVPADELQITCALCGELFEDFYSDEDEEWMYKGAVYLNVPQGESTEGLDKSSLGPIVHMKCKTESAETATVDSMDDNDEVQPELQAADSVRMEVDGMGEDNIMPLLTDNFDLSEIKEEQEEVGSRTKRTRY